MCWRNYFSPIPLQCTENSTSVPINFNVTNNLLQSRSTSMYRKFDFSSNELQYNEKLTIVPIHFNVPKTRILPHIFPRTFHAYADPFSLVLSPRLYKQLAAEWPINSDLLLVVRCEVTERLFIKPFDSRRPHDWDCVPLPAYLVTFDWFWCLRNVWSHSTKDTDVHVRLQLLNRGNFVFSFVCLFVSSSVTD